MWSNSEYLPGIDISHHNNIVDWRLVKESGVAFTFLKATEGTDFLDEHFHNNWSNTRREGLIRGAYHFFVPEDDPMEQAQNYLDAVGDLLHASDLPPVIDVESSPKYIYESLLKFSVEERQQRLKIWLDVVAQATGRQPIIYTNFYTWKIFWGDTEGFTDYPLWIANINVETPKIPANQWGEKGFTFWQFSFKGSVPGVLNGAAAVDKNVFKGSLDDLKSWLGPHEVRKLPPKILNHQMLEALSRSANHYGQSIDDWILKTSLNYLPKASIAELPYDGPAIADLALSEAEKIIVEENVNKIISTYKESIYTRLTNQDMINVFYKAAKKVGIAGWTLLEKVGLAEIVNKRTALYTGNKIDEFDQLSGEEKYALAEALGLDLTKFESGSIEEPEVEEPVVEEPVVEEPVVEEPVVEEPVIEEPVEEEPVVEEPVVEEPVAEEPVIDEPIVEEPVQLPDNIFGFPSDIKNQDMINAIYKVANHFGLPGWDLLQFAGLTYLINDRDSDYTGLMIDEMINLSTSQRDALAELLGVVLIETPSEIPPTPDPAIEPNPEGDSNSGPADGGTAPATYPGITNQDILEAFSNAEKLLKLDAGIMLLNANLHRIASSPDAYYTGPIVKDMRGLTSSQRAVLIEMILEQGNNDGSETYPGLVNQDIINIFYKAAAEYSEKGWDWMARSGLAYMVTSREIRYKPYRGPKFENIAELSLEKRELLNNLLRKLNN